MFKIGYEILEEVIQDIQGISSFEFDEDFHNIRGQILIQFNQKYIGLVQIGDELLVTWFQLLNQLVIHLQNDHYFSFLIPDTYNSWLQFEKNGNQIIVSEFKSIEQVTELVMYKPNNLNRDYVWREVLMDGIDFYYKIFDVTDNFISEIIKINIELINSKTLKELMELSNRAKMLTKKLSM